MSDLDKIYDEAVSLSEEARISLIEKLLSSLHLPVSADIDRQWAQEAEKRIAEIERGDQKLIPGEKVFAELREKFRK